MASGGPTVRPKQNALPSLSSKVQGMLPAESMADLSPSTTAQPPRGLKSRVGIPAFKVAQEPGALKRPDMVRPGKPSREKQAHVVEAPGPDHDAAQNQKRRPNRTGEQDPGDARDDQKLRQALGKRPH